jgi:hypothetical protein
MDDVVRRPTLVENINSAFSPQNVAISATRLRSVSRRSDFLAMSRVLGILGDMDDRTFRRYRRSMPIPREIQQILTAVHRLALFADPPKPMQIQINNTPHTAIEVRVTDQLISIRLDRPDPAPRQR